MWGPGWERTERARAVASRAARDLAVVRQAPGSWRVATRAGLTMAAAMLALLVLDAVPLVPYATFGAFAVVYGGRAPVRARARVQLGAGAWLTLAVATGCLVALSPARGWLAVALGSVWAGAAAAISDRNRWIPPGPMFLVFAFATCATIPLSDPVTVVVAGLVAGSTAGLGIVLGLAEGWIAERRGTRSGAEPARGPDRPSARRRVQAMRCAAAVAVAGGLATALGIERPAWAMIAAVVPLAIDDVHHQLARGLHRVAGTFVGLGLAGLLLWWDLPTALALALVVVLQVVTELLVARHYGAALVCVTALALLVVHVSAPEPVGALLASRAIETVLGIAVGVAAAVLTRASPGMPAGPTPSAPSGHPQRDHEPQHEQQHRDGRGEHDASGT